jgi:hypothetical protein
LLRFQRYDLPLDKGQLVPQQFDVDADQHTRLRLQKLDDASIIPELSRLAEEAALKQVSMDDFRGFL